MDVKMIQKAKKMRGTVEEGSNAAKVRVDGEEAVLHLTDQSVLFEREGKVTGFERSAIRMVKPDGGAMIVAYSVGSEVKSVKIEPMAAVASLVVSHSTSAPAHTSATSLDELFDKLYWKAREELEGRLAKVEGEPENKSLRLSQEEEKRFAEISLQMESILGARYGFNHRDVEASPISFWGLEKQPLELQLAVVKERHIRFLRMIVEPKAETNDITYSTDEVWPDDWARILERFGLEQGPYTTPAFVNYVNYLRSHWKIAPGVRKPVLARP
jgi:hypothetical protein